MNWKYESHRENNKPAGGAYLGGGAGSLGKVSTLSLQKGVTPPSQKATANILMTHSKVKFTSPPPGD